MTRFNLTYFNFQVVLASFSFWFIYLYLTPKFSFMNQHFSNPTPTTVQCTKLQPFPLHTRIIYTQPHFLLQQSSDKWCTFIHLIKNKSCFFVLIFINYTFPHSLYFTFNPTWSNIILWCSHWYTYTHTKFYLHIYFSWSVNSKVHLKPHLHSVT